MLTLPKNHASTTKDRLAEIAEDQKAGKLRILEDYLVDGDHRFPKSEDVYRIYRDGVEGIYKNKKRGFVISYQLDSQSILVVYEEL